MDAPELLDDFYLNLLDWGGSNILAIALGNAVYLWDASDGSISELLAIGDEMGPVTSVRWSPDARHLAVGLNNSHVQLWDSVTSRLVCYSLLYISVCILTISSFHISVQTFLCLFCE